MASTYQRPGTRTCSVPGPAHGPWPRGHRTWRIVQGMARAPPADGRIQGIFHGRASRPGVTLEPTTGAAGRSSAARSHAVLGAHILSAFDRGAASRFPPRAGDEPRGSSKFRATTMRPKWYTARPRTIIGPVFPGREAAIEVRKQRRA